MLDVLQNLHYVKMIDGIEYYKFKPKFGKWFLTDWYGYKDDDKNTVRCWCRMFLEWVYGGYDVYYQVKENEIVGYAVVALGGRRLTVSNHSDIVIGPIFTPPKHRGQGYATKAMIAILEHIDIQYVNAYAFIKKSNKSSLRVFAKSGFKIIGEVSSRGIFKKLYLVDNGFFYLVCHHKQE